MKLLARVVDTSVIGFATWTVAYHLVFFIRLPAFWTPLAWVGLLVLAALYLRPAHSCRRKRSRLGDSLPTLLCGVGVAVWSAVVYLPFEDNYSFMHRALWQIGHLREPFEVHFTSLSASGLPPLSEAHLMTSVEMLGAFVGRGLHLDPIVVTMTLVPAVTAFIAVCGIGLLGKLLHVSPRGQVFLLMGFVVGALLCGNVMRSVGLFGLPRLSEGKCAMVVAGVPLAYLYLLRFAKAPTRRHWILLALVAVCFVGWTSSGILVAPVMFVLACVSRFIAAKPNVSGARNCVLMVSAAFYPVLCYGAAKAGFIPRVTDTSVWTNDWPATWSANIQLLAGGPLNLVVQGFAITVGVVLLCRRKDRWLGLVPLVAVVLIFNPICGPFAIKVIPPGVFWRIGYVSTFPLGLGLIFAAAGEFSRKRRALALCAAAAIVAMGWPLALPGSNRLVLGSPSKPKWWARELSVATESRKHLLPVSILAPERIACILAMLDPSLTFESIRPLETRHLFRNSITRAKEGEQRARAQEFIDTKTSDASGLSNRISAGLRQIIASKHVSTLVTAEAAKMGFQTETVPLGAFCLLKLKK